RHPRCGRPRQPGRARHRGGGPGGDRRRGVRQGVRRERPARPRRRRRGPAGGHYVAAAAVLNWATSPSKLVAIAARVRAEAADSLVMLFVAPAAFATASTLREISDVVAVCSSTALPMVDEMS